MSTAVERFTASRPCPICGGHERLPRGQGVRCEGYQAEDERGQTWVHCCRPQYAGDLSGRDNGAGSTSFPHLWRPVCDCPEERPRERCRCAHCGCGVVHNEVSNIQLKSNIVSMRKPDRKPVKDSDWARFASVYDYMTDEPEPRRMRVCRTAEKQFFQAIETEGLWNWGMGGLRAQIYRRDEVRAAVAAGDTVYIAEGERDVDALRERDLVATCNSGGAGKFPAEEAELFRGSYVVIIADRDEAGRKHARDVADKLGPVVADLRIVEAAAGKDARDHLEAGLGVEDFRETWGLPTQERDPVRWKQRVLRESLEAGRPYEEISFEAAKATPADPEWPSGLRGDPGRLPSLSGVTLLHGKASSAKSFLAIASSIEAALRGWDVLYLVAEMGARAVAERVERYCQGAPPETWRMIFVRRGAELVSLVDQISQRVSDRKMLVVIDSLSSFASQSPDAENPRDPFGIAFVNSAVMWAANVRGATSGQVSFLLIVEQNARGEVSGRRAAYKADISVSLESDASDPTIKLVRVEKGWQVRQGAVGRFLLDWRDASLTFVGEI